MAVVVVVVVVVVVDVVECWIHDIVVVHVVMVPSMVPAVGGAAVDAASYVSVLLLDFVSHPN